MYFRSLSSCGNCAHWDRAHRHNPFVFQVSFFTEARWWIDRRTLVSQSLCISGLFLPLVQNQDRSEVGRSQSICISGLFLHAPCVSLYETTTDESQSLCISGLFLQEALGKETAPATTSHNPFVFQVSFFLYKVTHSCGHVTE